MKRQKSLNGVVWPAGSNLRHTNGNQAVPSTPDEKEFFKQYWIKLLWDRGYTHFVTLTSSFPMGQQLARAKVIEFHTELKRILNESPMEMFFVIEKYYDQPNYHIHALIRSKGAIYQDTFSVCWNNVLNNFIRSKQKQICLGEPIQNKESVSRYVTKYIRSPKTDYDFRDNPESLKFNN